MRTLSLEEDTVIECEDSVKLVVQNMRHCSVTNGVEGYVTVEESSRNVLNPLSMETSP